MGNRESEKQSADARNVAPPIPPGFNPDMSQAPRDRPIVGWCNHKADPYWVDDGYLTIYGAHVEGLGHVEDGPHVIEWGGEYDGGEEGSIPDWWFRSGSDWEEAANPVGWLDLPKPAAGEAEGSSAKNEATA